MNAKIIIFPYGKIGQETVYIMRKEFGRKPYLIIDNNKADGKNIFGIEILNQNKYKDGLLLVTCKSNCYLQNIIEQANRFFDKNKIEILFEPSKISKKARRIHPFEKTVFLSGIKNDKSIKLLDVGCGNESALAIKRILSEIFYIGLDVGDYNQSSTSFGLMDEYIVVSPESFDSEIEKMENGVDVIISSHNIEHCNEPHRCITAMANALKKGGRMYLAFPSEHSVKLPSRGGTLNFYDDKSHIYLPEFDWIVSELKRCGLTIDHASKIYRPLGLVWRGIKNERASRKKNKVMEGTWALYGFESIIWARKP